MTPPPFTVHAIDPRRLATIRERGEDGHGNALQPFRATGDGEPLRCCLRHADAGEVITLISHAPFEHRSVWTEVGPVYVHVAACHGPTTTSQLPAGLDRGPRVLRTYDADHAMAYSHNTVILDDVDLTPIVEGLLAEPEVATVHVRTLAPQCFLYAVTA